MVEGWEIEVGEDMNKELDWHTKKGRHTVLWIISEMVTE